MDKVKGWAVPIAWAGLVTLMVAHLVLAAPGLDFWVKLFGFLAIFLLCLGIQNMGEDKPTPEELARKRREAKRRYPLSTKGKP